jgi:hypothetical protein
VYASLSSRLPFLLAIALVAAAIGDPLVETIANTGAIGRGFSDNNHLSVIPTLIAGLLLVSLAIGRRCLDLCRHCPRRGDWVIETAKRFCERPPLDDLPYVIFLQFAALFVMESTEQLVFGGRLLGGAAWLGGPIFFSVVAHALIGAVCCIAITQNARAIVKRFATLFAGTLNFILLVLHRQSCALFAPRRSEPTPRALQILDVRRIGERAPPALLALT